jgi:hypothetical protein
MSQPVLSRSQRNDIFEMIRGHKLDPADFEWSIRTEGWQVIEVVLHRPTSAYIEISAANEGGFWLAWWPHSGQSRQCKDANHWQLALGIVNVWLDAVHKDHTAPDLWGELAKGQAIPAAARKTEYEGKFSSEELKLLEAGLEDIERYISATQPLDPPSKQQVHKRFEYLLDAAKHGARKVDWLNIFVGVVIGLVTEGLLDARVYGAIMTHATTVLHAVFQFGVKLLS